MRHYETVAGVVTRGETLSKLLHDIKEAEDLCYVLAHLHNTEDSDTDRLLATGWRGIGQLFDMMHHKVTQLGMRRMQ